MPTLYNRVLVVSVVPGISGDLEIGIHHIMAPPMMTAAPITTAAGRLSPTVLPYPAAMLPVCMTKVVEGVELVCELCADTGAEVADWLAAAG